MSVNNVHSLKVFSLGINAKSPLIVLGHVLTTCTCICLLTMFCYIVIRDFKSIIESNMLKVTANTHCDQ